MSGTRLIYRRLSSAAEWRAAQGGDGPWYRDERCRVPATAEDLERADDDVHTRFGMNVTPRRYPTLAWKEVLR